MFGCLNVDEPPGYCLHTLVVIKFTSALYVALDTSASWSSYSLLGIVNSVGYLKVSLLFWLVPSVSLTVSTNEKYVL